MIAKHEAPMDLEGRKRRMMARSPVGVAASAASQAALAAGGTIARVEKGRALFGQGDAAAAVALVGAGRLRLLRALSGGQHLSLGYRGAGDLVGEGALAGASARRESAIAAEDVEALLIPVESLRGALASDPGFASALVQAIVERNNDTEERVASMLFRNVESRLAEFLLKAAARWGIPDPRGTLIAAPFTHQEMAGMIGSTRETVTLTLGDLKQRGVLDVDRRRVVVRDRDSLRACIG